MASMVTAMPLEIEAIRQGIQACGAWYLLFVSLWPTVTFDGDGSTKREYN